MVISLHQNIKHRITLNERKTRAGISVCPCFFIGRKIKSREKTAKESGLYTQLELRMALFKGNGKNEFGDNQRVSGNFFKLFH